MSTDRSFTSEELDKMGVDRHVHHFIEQYSSGERNRISGKQERRFRCRECGFIRHVPILGEEWRGEEV